MANAVKQETNANSGSSSTTLALTLGAAPTSGNLLVMWMAGDKNTGALTLTGFTQQHQILGASTSLYCYWKISDGTETTINPSWASSSSAGNTAWYAELEDTAVSGSTWEVAGSASTTYSDSTANARSSNTTGTVTRACLALGGWAVDSSTSVSGARVYSNSYAFEYEATGLSGRGAIFVASKSVTSGTTECQFSYTGTADQIAGAVVAFAKVDDGVVTATATFDQAAATWAATATESIPATATFAQTSTWAAVASERFTSTATFAQGAAAWAATATERFTGSASFLQTAATWDAAGQERLAASAAWTQTATWSVVGLVANPVTATATFEQTAAWEATASERFTSTAAFAQDATWAAAASEGIQAVATWSQDASWAAVGLSAEDVTAAATWVQAAAAWQATEGDTVTGSATFEQAAAAWAAQVIESIPSDATFEQVAQWAAVGQLAYIAAATFEQSANWAAAMSAPSGSLIVGGFPPLAASVSPVPFGGVLDVPAGQATSLNPE